MDYNTGGNMGKITQMRRLRNYYRIFEQIYEVPTMSIYEISQNTGISRNTVAKYVKDMYVKGILRGPCIRMKPALHYKEYVYLLNFSDPWIAFNGLKGFSHVVYCAMAFGDWNTMVITDRPLDFSKLVGFENVVKQGVRYCSYTPKVRFRTWDESFEKIYEHIDRFTPAREECKDRRLTPLDWGTDEWKLFSAFNFMRRKATPLLRKIRIRYETYTQWMETLETHCTIHTGFYPQGYETYTNYCFLFFTEYEESVKSLFSLFPTTPFIVELDKQLLIFTHVTSSEMKRRLFCFIYDMKTKKMIKRYRQAVVLFHSPNISGRVE